MTSLLSAYVCLKYLMYLVWSSQETPSQTNPALDWFSTSVKERAGRKGAGFKWVLCRHCIWHRPPHSSFTCFHRVCVWSSAHSHALYSCLCLSFSAFVHLSLSPQLCASLSFPCLYTRPHFCLRGPSGFSLTLWHSLYAVCFKALGPERKISQFPLSHRQSCVLNTKGVYLPETAIKQIQSTKLGYKIMNCHN